MDYKMNFFNQLAQSSIMAVFRAAAEQFDLGQDRGYAPNLSDDEELGTPNLALGSEEEEENCNWEGMGLSRGFNPWDDDVDPEQLSGGMRMGVPRNQLLVSSPIQGMLKPSPIYPLED